MYAVFVLRPLALTVQYSLYRWDGIGPSQWVGPEQLRRRCSPTRTCWHHPQRVQADRVLQRSSRCARAGRRVASSAGSRPGGSAPSPRTVLFLPQVIPLVAAGIAWSWLLSSTGLVNQVCRAIGLGGVTRAWLGDFDLALPAVGVIGAWVLLGFCTILLLTGMSKIDPALYESARLDGAGLSGSSSRSRCPACARRSACAHRHRDRRPGQLRHRLRRHRRRPRRCDHGPRPGDLPLAFCQRQVGLASALAVVLMLLVLVVVLPIQRLAAGRSR